MISKTLALAIALGYCNAVSTEQFSAWSAPGVEAKPKTQLEDIIAEEVKIKGYTDNVTDIGSGVDSRKQQVEQLSSQIALVSWLASMNQAPVIETTAMLSFAETVVAALEDKLRLGDDENPAGTFTTDFENTLSDIADLELMIASVPSYNSRLDTVVSKFGRIIGLNERLDIINSDFEVIISSAEENKVEIDAITAQLGSAPFDGYMDYWTERKLALDKIQMAPDSVFYTMVDPPVAFDGSRPTNTFTTFCLPDGIEYEFFLTLKSTFSRLSTIARIELQEVNGITRTTRAASWARNTEPKTQEFTLYHRGKSGKSGKGTSFEIVYTKPFASGDSVSMPNAFSWGYKLFPVTYAADIIVSKPGSCE